VQFLKVVSLFLILLLTVKSIGQTQSIDRDQFSEKDLVDTTVYPKLEKRIVIINKNIEHDNSFDLSVDSLFRTDDLYYDPLSFSIKGSYYWNSEWGGGLLYNMLSRKYNNYVNEFENMSAQLQFDRAPQPNHLITVFLNQAFFYGKINLTNDIVFNQILLARYQLGATQYESLGYLPYLSGSIALQTFIIHKMYLELGYGLALHEVYNPISKNIRAQAPVVTKSEFSKKIQMSQTLSLSLGFLFSF